MRDFEDSFSEEIWRVTYKDHKDNSLADTVRRVALNIASVEDTPEKRAEWTEKFQDLLTHFKAVPGGRILANAGTDWGATTYMNCYVGPLPSADLDSIEGIYGVLKDQANTLKSEGGWGMNFSWIRPRGSFIAGVGVESPGSVRFMELFDKSSEIVTSGSGKVASHKKAKGKIRKGAMMGVLDCLSGSTMIDTIQGRVALKDLVGQTPYLYCTDGQGKVYVRQALAVFSKGVRKTVRVVFDTGDTLECTPDHEIMLATGKFVAAKDLKFSDSVAALNLRLLNGYLFVGVAGARGQTAVHNAVYEMKYGAYPTSLGGNRTGDSTLAHHVDHDTTNNHPDNIQSMTVSEHAKHHSDILTEHRKRIASERKGKTWEEYYGEEKAQEIREKYAAKRKGQTPWNAGMNREEYKEHYENGFSNQFVENSNHKVLRVEEIGEQEVFDISMPDYHNFSANGVFVHNCWHPDVVEFINAKQSAGRLTKFNVSVNCTDEFMEKVNKIHALEARMASGEKYTIDPRIAEIYGGEGPAETAVERWNEKLLEMLDKWELVFPDTSHPNYKAEWQGDIRAWRAKGYPVIVHNTVSVRWLWNLIMESTYNRNEPGVLFLDRANYFAPASYFERILSTNPCFTGDTLVLTSEGYKSLRSLVGKTVSVWNGSEWSDVQPRITATDQEILDIHLSDGTLLSCTPYHSFILADGGRKEAKDLDIGQKLAKFELPVVEGEQTLRSAYTRGVYSGDGTRNTTTVFLYGEKKALLEHLDHRSFSEHASSSEETRLCVVLDVKDLVKDFVPDAEYTVQSRLDWLAGLIDTDGTVAEGCAQITSVNREFLLQTKLMLNTLGANGSVSLCKPASKKLMPNGNGGEKEYQTQDCWRLNVSATFMQKLVALGLTTHRVKFDHVPARSAARFLEVVSVVKRESLEPEVFCFNEPKNHTGVFNGVMTGQCGEQTLAPGGVCCLGTLNLTQFVKHDLSGFDLDRLCRYVGYLVRFLDNVNTISGAPLDQYLHSMHHKRRIGCGVMGWGSALFMMKVRFGSQRADELREQLMSTYARAVYEASIDLAAEKGMFSYCDPEAHANAPFVKALGLSDAYMDKLRLTGIRNSSLLSQQPNGNTSILANVVSGGIEPIFMPEYIRTVGVPVAPAHLEAVTPKYSEGQFHETEFFKLAKEGDEDILRGVAADGTVWKIDRNRGLTKEVPCEDYGVRFLKSRGEWDPNADWAVTTTQLSVEDHVNDLKGFARWTDSACSKTCNLPNDYPYEDFKNLYLEVYNTGFIKGFTTYRAGTMTSVLSAKDEKTADPDDEEIIIEDVKLPDSLPATLKTLRAEGKKFYLTVIMNEGQTRPVALFSHTNQAEKRVTISDAVERLLNLARSKGIPEQHVSAVEAKIAGDNSHTKVCRLISLNLRHGVLIKNVVSTLDKVDCVAGSFVFHVRKFLASFIKDGEDVAGETCQECGSDKVVYQEGCKVCSNCGSSKCG